jgi:phosphatidate cytidylyltransferase
MKDILRLDIIENNDLLIIVFLIFGLLTFASLLFFIVGKIKPNANLKELKDRTKSWWVMAIVFICATLINTTISYFAIALLSFIAFRELYSVLGFRQTDRRAIFWAFLSIPIQYYLAYIGWYGAFIIFIPVVMFLFLPLRLVLKGDTAGITKSMSTLHWILMLTVFGISHMAYLLSLPEIEGFASGGRGLLLFWFF